MEREHGRPAEGAASFHTTRWTIVMNAAQSQAPGESSLWLSCAALIGIRSICSLGAAGIPRITPRT